VRTVSRLRYEPSVTFSASQASPSSQEPVLSQREYDFLEALYLLEATSPFDRRSTKEVAERSEGGSVNPERFKETVASLVRLGLVSTKEGRGGGCWLTRDGVALAKRLTKGKKR